MADREAGGWHYTSNPLTIWALPEEVRPAAVMQMVAKLAEEYKDAAAKNRGDEAKRIAASAIQVMAGFFPERDSPVHNMVHSMVGALVAARHGKRRHILLEPGRPIPGTKGGYGDALVKSFAVASAQVLVNLGLSRFLARKRVAAILAARGYSRRSDENHMPLSITASAVRRWEEEVQANPIPSAVAPAMKETIEDDIRKNGLTNIAEIEVLIADHADAFLPLALAY